MVSIQRAKHESSSALSPCASVCAKRSCICRPRAMMLDAFSVGSRRSLRRSPGTLLRSRKPQRDERVDVQRDNAGLEPPHGADVLCGAVFRVVREKQQNLRCRLRNRKLAAERLHGGAVGVHETLGMDVELCRGQKILHANCLQN